MPGDITGQEKGSEAYDLWLDPGFQKTDAICNVLKPFDAKADEAV
jgi:hypothetical protein